MIAKKEEEKIYLGPQEVRACKAGKSSKTSVGLRR